MFGSEEQETTESYSNQRIFAAKKPSPPNSGAARGGRETEAGAQISITSTMLTNLCVFPLSASSECGPSSDSVTFQFNSPAPSHFLSLCPKAYRGSLPSPARLWILGQVSSLAQSAGTLRRGVGESTACLVQGPIVRV